MNKNLKKTLERPLVDQFWWYIPQKIGILLLISNAYISWPVKGHRRSNLGQNGRISRNVFNIHTFRLRILPRIKSQTIWGQVRPYKVIGGQTRVELVKKRVKSGCLVQLYIIYICSHPKSNHSYVQTQKPFFVFLDFWLVRALEGVETSRFMYIWPHAASKKKCG